MGERTDARAKNVMVGPDAHRPLVLTAVAMKYVGIDDIKEPNSACRTSQVVS